MQNDELLRTVEEQKTFETYKVYASKYAARGDDPLFWQYDIGLLARMLPRNSKVIDLGCGTGRDAPLLIEKGLQYFGVDFSQEMLAEARKSCPDALFREMDLYRLTIADSVFDGFWAAASYLHLPKHKLSVALQEVRRILKPDGRGVFVMLEGEGEAMFGGRSGGSERFYAKYSEIEFTRRLQDMDFVVNRVTKDTRLEGMVWLLFWVEVKK